MRNADYAPKIHANVSRVAPLFGNAYYQIVLKLRGSPDAVETREGYYSRRGQKRN